ncbi:uncharacterized protein V2V93DRAFT_356943 [Kockiozyma suomiensis]|uniref:uncharacterized protein n=1 Tax=Kockiozyma suomiensis TaxID=1337062 RepID=UPI003342EFA0
MIGSSLLRPVARAASASTRSFSSSAARNDLARLSLIGRLGTDIEKQTSANGREYARYTVAVRPSRNSETSWYHVVCFDSNLSYLVENYRKGSLVYVEAGATLQPFETSDGRRIGSLQLVHKSIHKISNPSKSYETNDGEGEVADAESEEVESK